jgi:plastocyanin
MRVIGQILLGLALLAVEPAIARPAGAAELVVQVTDADGRPVADAVVALAPRGALAAAPPAPMPRLIVDQRNETFIPYVQIVPLGGTVTFRNSDLTRHHVYSFSPIKAFEFMLVPGEASEPVRFERTGVVAIGCNIHDRMVAYLYVTDLPWASLTDQQGRAVLSDPPDGTYMLHTWHPRLRPGRPEPTQPVTLAGTPGQVAISLSLLRDQARRPDPERARY